MEFARPARCRPRVAGCPTGVCHQPDHGVGLHSCEHDAGLSCVLADPQAALANITSRAQARWLSADLRPATPPSLASYSEVTDAYLIEMARLHNLKLATLDNDLCTKSWAGGIAENPL